MGIDYWGLMSQPASHVEKYLLWLFVKDKVQEEEHKKMENKVKGKK